MNTTISHSGQKDNPRLDRELRDLATAVRALEEGLTSNNRSGAENVISITGIKVGNREYSIAAKTEDGVVQLIPGLMVPSDKPKVTPTPGQVLIAQQDGTYIPASLTAGAGIAIDEATGSVTITGFDQMSTLIEVARTGLYRGSTAYLFNIMGSRSAWVNNTSLHDACEFLSTGAGQQEYPVPSTAYQLDIVSSSAQDSSTASGGIDGTGVRTVRVVYINNNGAITDTGSIALNGTTGVTAIASNCAFVLWMEAITTDSTTIPSVAAGNITLYRNGFTSTIYEQISAGGNKSLSGRFRVPTGYTGYILGWEAAAINQDMDTRLRATVSTYARASQQPFLFQDRIYLALNTNSGGGHTNFVPLKLPAGADIKISAKPGATTGSPRFDGSFTVLLVAN
jgi:hypothetical protein